MFKNMRIGLRLGIGFGLVLLIFTAVCFFIINRLDFMSSLTDMMYRHPLTVSNAVLEIEADIARIHRSMKDVVLATDNAEIDERSRLVNQYEEEIYRDFKTIMERFLGDREMYQDAIEVYKNWKPIRDEVIALMRQGKKTEAADITKGKGARHVEKLDKAMLALHDFALSKAESFHNDTLDTRVTTLRMVYIVLGAAMLVGIIFMIFFTRSITRPLSKLVDSAVAMRQGNLDTRIQVNSEDEIGNLATAFRKMAGDLKELYAGLEDKVRMRTEEIRQSKILLESSIESPKDMIILSLDREYRYLYFNKTHAEVMDHVYGTRSRIGDCIFDHMKGKGDIETVKSHYDRAMAGEGHVAIEEYGEGQVRYPYETRYSPVYNEKNEIIGVTAFAQNITERKQAEEALRESEEKYRQLFSTESDAIMVFDAETLQFVDANLSTELLYGYSREEFLSLKVTDISAEIEDTEKTVREIVEGKSNRVSLRYQKKKDGTVFPAEISAGSFKLAGRQMLCGIVRDITERKRIEEELLKMEKLESVGTLAGGIAHDLNNLLTGVLGNISLARLYEDPADRDKRLAEAEKASMRIKDLTQQLLTFSKGGAPILQTSDITGLLRDSADFALRGSNVTCEFSIPDDSWPVEIDEGQINQVINNLIINARQAMPNGGTVRISVENMTIGAEFSPPLEPGAYIKVSVEDEGTGIPEDHIQKIFDPFFTTKQTGSGLGLATSYSIIEKHDGHINVESQSGVGTTFHIYLPASPDEVLVRKEEETEEPIMGEGSILVMDDEETVREFASNMLTNIGYEVITAVDGAEAIELYKAAMESGIPFDAVIVDLTIPGGMGGAETIQKLIEIDPEVKAIVSSGYSNDPILANFGEHGFKNVIAKPYEARQMSEVLHRVMTGAND